MSDGENPMGVKEKASGEDYLRTCENTNFSQVPRLRSHHRVTTRDYPRHSHEKLQRAARSDQAISWFCGQTAWR